MDHSCTVELTKTLMTSLDEARGFHGNWSDMQVFRTGHHTEAGGQERKMNVIRRWAGHPPTPHPPLSLHQRGGLCPLFSLSLSPTLLGLLRNSTWHPELGNIPRTKPACSSCPVAGGFFLASLQVDADLEVLPYWGLWRANIHWWNILDNFSH